jgi:ketosteroid isomerase-like protein
MDGKDGLEFAGGEPKRGEQEIFDAHGGNAPPKSVLTWKPAEVFVSAGGDMGVTWGHWLSKPGDPEKKPATGRYVTVWRKDASGGWKGIIDIGDAD